MKFLKVFYLILFLLFISGLPNRLGTLLQWGTELFDRYCNWLFGILFVLEKEVRISPYLYQQRVFGFIAERLMLLYCIRNKLKTY